MWAVALKGRLVARVVGGTGQRRWGSLRNKIVGLDDAVQCVRSGDTVGVGGFVAQNSPEALLRGLGERFERTGEPSDLTVFFGGGPGDSATLGVSHFGKAGMLRRAIGAHYGQAPKVAELVLANKIEAYNLPLGSISRMLRATAAKQPGHLTRVGVGTMCDPEQGGGRLNERTKEDLVIPVTVEGERYLLYKAVPINVAFIRGTTADASGNITFEKESLYADNLVLAMAAKSSGGMVIAQVERIADRNTLRARNVKIPGAMVDAVVVADGAEDKRQSYFTEYNPFWAGDLRAPMEDLPALPFDTRKIVARRAALELRLNDIVNLGIGMPDGVANVASEEDILQFLTLTTEPGVFGGIGASGHDFGPASNYEAIVNMDQQFDFYNGGGLSIAFLGMAQVNCEGDVNVTRFGKKLTGPGGFIDISQCTPQVVFCGTFTSGGLEVEVADGKLRVVREGRCRKFVKSLVETSFSGREAWGRRQRVLYVTERCVFELSPEGLVLREVAPGIDVERDILAHMDFRPVLKGMTTMAPEIFTPKKKMGLKKKLIETRFEDRVQYNPQTNTLLIDLHHIFVSSLEQIENVEQQLTAFFEKHAEKNPENPRMHVVVNYEGFDCLKTLGEEWTAMAQRLESKWYLSARRCITSTFLRAKVAHGLHITKQGAQEAFKELDTDTTGYLTYPQCREFMEKVGRLIHSEDDLNRALRSADITKRGKLTFTELIAADAALNRVSGN